MVCRTEQLFQLCLKLLRLRNCILKFVIQWEILIFANAKENNLVDKLLRLQLDAVRLQVSIVAQKKSLERLTRQLEVKCQTALPKNLLSLRLFFRQPMASNILSACSVPMARLTRS